MSAVTRYAAEYGLTGGGFMRSTLESAIEDAVSKVDREGGGATIEAYHFPSALSEWGGDREWVATILPAWPEATS